MRLKRWQLIWTFLSALWLGGWATPMLFLWLGGDAEQLSIFFGMWVAVVLIPTVIVYVLGFLFGTFVIPAMRAVGQSRTASGRAVMLPASIVWALLVVVFSLIARGTMNPFHRFAAPLAVAVVLLVIIIPPTVLYTVGLIVDRIRQKDNKR